MRHLLQRHPLPIKAWFRHSLVLTYAFPEAVLQPLLPPGLQLDTFDGFGFLAVAIVETCALRPAFLPMPFGQDFVLTGYRLFTRFQIPAGRRLRGLRILRSDANRRRMVWGGNLLTRYNYRLSRAEVLETGEGLKVEISTPRGEADISLVAQLASPASSPPDGSPFRTLHEARLYAGPMPFTFDYEPETRSVIAIEGVRENWHPVPVSVRIDRLTFLDQPPFNQSTPRLANVFHVRDIPYTWKRGVCHSMA